MLTLTNVHLRSKTFTLAVASIVFTCLVMCIGIFVVLQQPSDATSTKGFDPGDIMSNAVMRNSSTMSESQIKSFLLSKNTCDKTVASAGGDVIDDSATKAHWKSAPSYTYQIRGGKKGTTKGTFNCLAKSSFGGETAPHIIYKAARYYHVNPQVLIVLLQKEQGLVTDVWPNSNQFAAATGYACPDHGQGCDPDDAGFKSQVRGAALLFDEVLSNKDLDGDNFITNYPVGINKVYYNPASSCGYSMVNIKNRATSALYRYTPYQPNAATLAAGWPMPGNIHCEADGNLNFYMYFTQWFGSTHGPYNFKFETLAGPNGLNKVNSSSLGDYTATVNQGGQIYTFYYDNGAKNLRLSHWNGKSWTGSILDGSGSTVRGAVSNNVGQNITATIWKNQVQVYYYDATNGSLRHAWLKNNVWSAEVLDGTANSISKTVANVGRSAKVLLWKGNIQLYYYNTTSKNIRHAWWPGDGRWHFETLVGSGGAGANINNNVGDSKIDAILWKNNIQLYYYDGSTKSLRHAWWPGDGRWHNETLDGINGSLGKSTDDMGSSVSAALYSGNLQIYYYDANDGSLRHAWWPGDGRWHFEVMDGEPTTTSHSTVLGNYINAGSRILATNVNGDLLVFYYDDASNSYWHSGSPYDHNSSWRLAYWKHGAWNQTIIDGSDTSSQSGSSAAVGGQLDATLYNNKVQVFYKGSSGQLMHVWQK